MKIRVAAAAVAALIDSSPVRGRPFFGEGEWAFRYTRIAGEFLWTRRELANVDASSRRT